MEDSAILTKIERILIAIFVVAAGFGFFAFMLIEANNSIAEAQRQEARTEADFVMKDYVLKEIWQRELTQQRGAMKQVYIFLKPEGEEFNLIFGSEKTDFGNETDVQDELLNVLRQGDRISVKVDKISLAAAQNSDIFSAVKRFLTDNNRELEMYRLDINGETIYEKPIQNGSFENRGFAMQNLLAAGLVLTALYMIVRNIIVFVWKRRKENV